MLLRFDGLNLSATTVLFADSKQLSNTISNTSRKQRRNCVTDLFCDFDLASTKFERIWESLQPGGFAMGNRSMFYGVKITPFLGLEKLGSDRKRGSIPPEPTE